MQYRNCKAGDKLSKSKTFLSEKKWRKRLGEVGRMTAVCSREENNVGEWKCGVPVYLRLEGKEGGEWRAFLSLHSQPNTRLSSPYTTGRNNRLSSLYTTSRKTGFPLSTQLAE